MRIGINMNELQLWHDLYQLEVKYWYDVDYNGGSSVHVSGEAP